jgi:WD40 repeat protein/3',5'-cyclic AMP phosphodiesterase CpdA/type II secretory pathway predicted ATPase ExeA
MPTESGEPQAVDTAHAQEPSPESLREVAILHVSDLQFGAHHRFGKDDEPLASRLVQDLAAIDAQIPKIDLFVVSGDLAETGMQSEFRQARAFIDELCAHLGLAHERVIVVPGNHDINRLLCEGYFATCKGNGEDPEFPYDPKWNPYIEFVTDLHGPEAFTPERPYDLHVFEHLKVVVAALNSTMRESHLPADHYGLCGDPQLQWFSTQLATYAGWTRIGVLHHNLRESGDTVEDERLRDAGDFTRILDGHLDVVLHGHTHDGKADRLANGTLVLGAGSAGLEQEYRPEEVGAQYQILSLGAGALTRWARRYEPRQHRWIADPSLSADGNSWCERIEVPSLSRPTDPARGDRRPEARSSATAELDDFLSEVAQVTRAKYGADCHITRRESPVESGYEYLLVASPGLQPIGALDAEIDQDALETFDRAVNRAFQQRTPHLPSYFVYAGVPRPELVSWASERGILLQTWAEYQDLLDLRPYTNELRAALASDRQYPQSLYLEQRYQQVDRSGRASEEIHNGLADTILEWLQADEQRFGLVFGEAGFGKSFLVRRLAYLLLEGRTRLTPVVVTLRDLEKHHSVVEMVSQTVTPSGVAFQLERFRQMFAMGRIVLLVDGYDELAVRVGYDRAADQLTTFTQAIEGRAKILLTTRSSHFRARDQATVVAFQEALSSTRHRIYELQPFDEDDRQEFLERCFRAAGVADPSAETVRWSASLSAVKNLPELARTPRMLSFMVNDLAIDELEAAARSPEAITAAALYERLLDTWLTTESEKAGEGASPSTGRVSVADRWRMAEELAFTLWRDQTFQIGQTLLSEVAARTLDLPKLGLSVSQAAQEIGSRTLLVGYGDRQRFAHQSVYEYLLARHLARALRDPLRWEQLGFAELSELSASFLSELAVEDAARWIAARDDTDPAGDWSTRNARTLLGVLQARGHARDLRVVSLAGKSLRGEVFSRGEDLTRADLRQTDLRGAQLTGTRLADAMLAGARLESARLDDADLERADLSGAVLDRASLIGANLTDCQLTDTSWERARLLGATIDLADIPASRLRGAALPSMTPRLCLPVPFGYGVLAMARKLGIIAIADEYVVALWDLETKRCLMTMDVEAVKCGTVALAFGELPDGSTILATGAEDGMVRLWDLRTRERIASLGGHNNEIHTLAFAEPTSDGTLLASGSDDGIVRTWNAQGGRQLATVTGTGDTRLQALALGTLADGGHALATGDEAGVVSLWDPTSGEFLATLPEQHKGPVSALAFGRLANHPDVLATGGDDHTIRMWNPLTHKLLGKPVQHEDKIRVLAFGRLPNGTDVLASASDRALCLWDSATKNAPTVIPTSGDILRSLAFGTLPDGEPVIVTGIDATRSMLSSGGVELWSTTSHKRIASLTTYRDRAETAVFSEEPGQATLLATSLNDGTVHLWHPEAHEHTTFTEAQKPIRCLALGRLPSGKTILAGAAGQTIHLWNTMTGAHTPLIAHVEEIRSLALGRLSSGKTILASGDHSGTIELWNPDNGEHIGPFVLNKRKSRGNALRMLAEREQTPEIAALAIARLPNGILALAASMDAGAVALWNLETRAHLALLTGHKMGVMALAFGALASGAALLATGSTDETICLWDPIAYEKLAILPGHHESVTSLAFGALPDGSTVLLSGSVDGTINCWLLDESIKERVDGEPVELRPTATVVMAASVRALTWSPQTATLAAALSNGAVELMRFDGPFLRTETTLLGTREGNAILHADGRYRMEGDVQGRFWWSAGLCRFEPGELDGYAGISEVP